MVLHAEVTLKVIAALERLQIPYMVVGSIAVAAHGVPRGTRDADLVADLHRGDGARIASELGSDFYFDAEFAEEGIRRRASLSAIYIPGTFKVDIFVLGSGPYERQAFERRIQTTFEPDSAPLVFVAAREDVILSKLKWYKLGGQISELQWRDTLGVLKLQAGALDCAYLRKWAEHEGVLDLLERAEREAAPLW